MATAISEALRALRERVEKEHGPGTTFRYDRRVGTRQKVVGRTDDHKLITESSTAYELVATDDHGKPLPNVAPVEYFPDIHDAEPRQPE